MTLSIYITFVILPILVIALILVFYRIYMGPATVDRVIALDLLITIGIGVITVYCVSVGNSTFLDVAMILALIALLGTIAFAYYIEQKGSSDD